VLGDVGNEATVEQVGVMPGGGEHAAQRGQIRGATRRDAQRGNGIDNEVGGCSRVEHGAPFDHDQPVADLLELTEHVRRHQHRPPIGCDARDDLAHLSHALRVQTVGRLVEDQEARIAEHCPGDSQPLLHAERVATKRIATAVVEADELQERRDSIRIVATDDREHLQVRGATQGGVERRALDQRTDGRQVPRGLVEGMAQDGPGAGGRAHESEQHRHRRRLAGAIRPDESGNDAGRHFEREVGNGDPGAELLGESGDGQCGKSHVTIVIAPSQRVVVRGAAFALRRRE
jgi:hypothetical protein